MENENRKPSRKIIIAILFPVVLFIVVCTIAEKLSYRGNNPFDLDRTWYLWVLYAFIVAYWEDLIFFRSQKRKSDVKSDQTQDL
ncbi:MAG: hypothetical protein K9H64_10320 [Bacteroidales bacterium]|nr:hypothetical protein [Bacteroidales bacterium]MCF8456263.1 hypothetical protein [Bacteroidales bacterium]